MKLPKALTRSLRAIGRRHCRKAHLASWNPTDGGRECGECGRKWVREYGRPTTVTRSDLKRAGAAL